MCYISKMAGNRVKPTKIWASEVSTYCMQSTMIVVFKVSLGSLNAFPILYNLVSPKQLVVKKLGIGDKHLVYTGYRYVLKVSLGHSVLFSIFDNLASV